MGARTGERRVDARIGYAVERGRSAPSASRDESGSILVLFAVLLPLFLFCCAVVIDVGWWWANAKRAQIAADACALAAASTLPKAYADSECVLDGITPTADNPDWALTNLPLEGKANEPRHMETVVTSPYDAEESGPDDDERYVEAKVTIAVSTFFGRIINKDYLTITRRAVAEKLEGTSKLAVFAGSTSCADQKGLYIDGDGINVVGHVHSNGEYGINSSYPPDHFTATSGTVANPTGDCKELTPPGPPSGTVETAGAEYTSAPGEWLPRDGELLQWPDWWYPGDFGWYLPAQQPAVAGRCTYKGQQIDVNDTELKVNGTVVATLLPNPLKPGWDVIPEGTYCATESFKVTGEKHTGRITVLAPIIQIAGKGQEYQPYGDMLFFTVPNSNTNAGDDGPYTLGTSMPEDKPPPPPPCDPSPAKETELNGEGFTWGGIIFNPCGKVLINVFTSDIGTAELVGTIYGFQVHVNGNEFNLIGTQELENSFDTALVE